MQIKDYNVVTDGRNFFDRSIRKYLEIYDNIGQRVIGQGNEYTTGCLLDYPYFKKYYKLFTIDLRKQQKLDADPKAIQQINFNGNLTRQEDARIYFIIEKAKETVLNFPKRTAKL